MLINKKGFTLIEIIVAMTIVAILFVGIGTAAAGQQSRAAIQSTSTIMDVFASDIEAVIEDVGVIEFSADTTEAIKRTDIMEYITTIENAYTHTYFAKDTLEIEGSRFVIYTKTQLDSWDAPLKLVYNTDKAKGAPGTCMFISSGPNMYFDEEGYATGNFGDDIIVIAKPKGV